MGDGGGVSGATGFITIERTPQGLVYAWEGGDIIWMTSALCHLLINDGVLDHAPTRDETFTIGPYTLRCTEVLIRPQVIEAVRVDS